MATTTVKESTLTTFAKKYGMLSVPLALVLIAYLATAGDIAVNSYSGNQICAGTITDPCYAYVTFTALKDITISPMTTPWGISSNGTLRSVDFQVYNNGWNSVDLTQPLSGQAYAYKFYSGKNYSIRFIAQKTDPFQTVKWSFGSVDPLWIGVSTMRTSPNSETSLYKNFSLTTDKANYTGSDFSAYVNITALNNSVMVPDISAYINTQNTGAKVVGIAQGTITNITANTTTKVCYPIYTTPTVMTIPNCTIVNSTGARYVGISWKAMKYSNTSGSYFTNSSTAIMKMNAGDVKLYRIDFHVPMTSSGEFTLTTPDGSYIDPSWISQGYLIYNGAWQINHQHEFVAGDTEEQDGNYWNVTIAGSTNGPEATYGSIDYQFKIGHNLTFTGYFSSKNEWLWMMATSDANMTYNGNGGVTCPNGAGHTYFGTEGASDWKVNGADDGNCGTTFNNATGWDYTSEHAYKIMWWNNSGTNEMDYYIDGNWVSKNTAYVPTKPMYIGMFGQEYYGHTVSMLVKNIQLDDMNATPPSNHAPYWSNPINVTT